MSGGGGHSPFPKLIQKFQVRLGFTLFDMAFFNPQPCPMIQLQAIDQSEPLLFQKISIQDIVFPHAQKRGRLY